jgi:hypothetical protein
VCSLNELGVAVYWFLNSFLKRITNDMLRSILKYSYYCDKIKYLSYVFRL